MNVLRQLIGDTHPSPAKMAHLTEALAFSEISYAQTRRSGLEVSGDTLARAKQQRRPKARHGEQRLGRHGELETLQIAWPGRRRRVGLHAKWQ